MLGNDCNFDAKPTILLADIIVHSLLCSTPTQKTVYYCVNKTMTMSRARGLEQEKLTCSAPCLTHCSAQDENLKVKKTLSEKTLNHSY